MTAVAEFVSERLGVEDPDALVTLPCPECGKDITGKPRGAGSVNFKMGTHRRNIHGVKGTSKKAQRRGGPTEAEREAHPVTSVIRDIAAEARGTKGAPTGDQLGDALGEGLGIATFSAAVLAIESDRNIPAQIKQQMIDRLTLEPADAKALMRPVGKMLAPTSINRRFGRVVVDNIDIVGSIAAVAQLSWHWIEYMKFRREMAALAMAQMREAAASGQAPPGLAQVIPMSPAMPQQPPPGPEMAPPTPGVPFAHTTGGTQGTIAGPADVARIQAQRDAQAAAAGAR